MGGNREGIMDLDLGAIYPRKKRLWVKAVRLGIRAGWFSLKVVIALALPFFLLVRGSVYAYQDLGWGTWASLASGVFATALLFLAYASTLWKKMTGEAEGSTIGQAASLCGRGRLLGVWLAVSVGGERQDA